VCTCTRVCTVCSFALEDEARGFQIVRALVSWRGGLFSTEGQIKSLLSCVFSIFDVGGSVRADMCVYTHTHTHCTWGTRREPRGRDETPGGPEELWARWTKSRHICTRRCVQSTHVYIYVGRWDEI